MPFETWHNNTSELFNYIFYVLKKHIGLSLKEIQNINNDNAFLFYNQFRKEKNQEGITDLRLHGFDPETIPAYNDILQVPLPTAEMGAEEKDTYKNLIDKLLEEKRNGREK